MRTILIILALAVGVLAWTNPDSGDFGEFIGRHAQKIVADQAGDSRWGPLLSEAGGSAAAVIARRAAHRENYFVASTYTIDLNPNRDDEQWRFLGIWGTFYELERPRSLR